MREDLWTAEQSEAFRVMWEQGVSTTEIAKRLGKPKGAVVGRRDRMGLEPRGPVGCGRGGLQVTYAEAVINIGIARTASISRKRRKERQLAKKKRCYESLSRLPMSDLPKRAAKAVAMEDADYRTCRWLVAWPDGITVESEMFCSEPAMPGKSWCEHHHGRVFVPPKAGP